MYNVECVSKLYLLPSQNRNCNKNTKFNWVSIKLEWFYSFDLPIEPVLLDKGNNGIHKRGPSGSWCCHLKILYWLINRLKCKAKILHFYKTNPRVLGWSSVPSAVRDKCFKIRILFFQTGKPQQSAFTTAISDVVPGVVQCNCIICTKISESVDDVSAQVNGDVFYVKFAISRSVHSPGAIVAHNLLCFDLNLVGFY